MVEYEKIIDALGKYIEKHIFPTFNEVQLFVGNFALMRYRRNAMMLKELLEDNPLLKPLCLFDDEGMVDVNSWMDDLKAVMDKMGKLKIEIPYVGPYTFTKSDLDVLHDHIKEIAYDYN
jgi:hypothetical protein